MVVVKILQNKFCEVKYYVVSISKFFLPKKLQFRIRFLRFRFMWSLEPHGRMILHLNRNQELHQFHC